LIQLNTFFSANDRNGPRDFKPDRRKLDIS